MMIISSREFSENQKRYFDQVDNGEQVIVQRSRGKAYMLAPVTEDDRFFSDAQVIKRINHSIAQADAGETISVKKEDIRAFLGL